MGFVSTACTRGYNHLQITETSIFHPPKINAFPPFYIKNFVPCLVLKGEQYWKTILKGVKEGAKTNTSHIVLFPIGGSSEEK